jgi:hypothetical protein
MTAVARASVITNRKDEMLRPAFSLPGVAKVGNCSRGHDNERGGGVFLFARARPFVTPYAEMLLAPWATFSAQVARSGFALNRNLKLNDHFRVAPCPTPKECPI